MKKSYGVRRIWQEMSKSTVALIRCDNYDYEIVYRCVKRGIDLLGGISGFSRPGERVLLKPNVLWGTDPKKCVTTHPAVFKAAGKLLLEKGVKVYYGDSSGFGGVEANLKKAALTSVAEESGMMLADFAHGEPVEHKSALLVKRFIIAKGVLDSDGVISLSKFKTHALMRFTGAIKNQFGCIPGLLKSQFHVRMNDPYDFASMLADLNTLIRPRLYVMDGITAMEGNGPRNGKPRQMNVLLFSRDPVAIDAVACRLIDMNPAFVPTSAAGERAGLGTFHDENIELVGDNIDQFVKKDFEIVRKPPAVSSGSGLMAFFKNQICPRPVVDRSKCTQCGLCLNVCPVSPKAIKWHEGKAGKSPKHNYDKCIRCYCCQELCPEGAISLRETLGSLMFH